MEGKTRTHYARELGISRSTLYRMERAGAIPAAVRASGNRSYFTPQAQRTIRNIVGAV